MTQESPSHYYMVVDEKSTGPFTLDEITLHPQLTPDTLVWKPGLDNWVAAKSLPELDPAFVSTRQNSSEQRPPEYNQNSYQEPKNNFNNYQQPYNQHQERNQFADNPQYHQQHTYQNHQRPYHNYDRYQNGYRPAMRTNWLPWAIIATIVGFFASCIGAVFGIIGIIQANRANNMYAQGYDREGDAANSNAKIMTIIGLVFAGIGILIALYFGNMIGNFSNLAYF